MSKPAAVIVVFFLFTCSLLGAQPVDVQAAREVPAPNYVVDPAHTSIEFVVTHMVISKVRGEFKQFDVQLYWDESNPENSYVVAEIDAASLDTDNQRRDGHLRSPNFFDVQNYPKLTFRSHAIRKSEQGFVARGELTIRGITRPVDLPFQVLGPIQDPWGNTRLGIQASTTINRKDFGMTWNRTMDNGGVVVGDEVQIEIQAEFVKKKAEEPEASQ